MAELVYLLCMLTSIACAMLLVRGYRHHRTRILLWSILCFTGLALNNALLFVDLAMLPATIDLSMLRAIVALASVSILVIGLIWDAR
ncbi:MAG: DUF5985 family protein [Polyangiales bacterium]